MYPALDLVEMEHPLGMNHQTIPMQTTPLPRTIGGKAQMIITCSQRHTHIWIVPTLRLH